MKVESKTCGHCNQEFVPHPKAINFQRFCSVQCRTKEQTELDKYSGASARRSREYRKRKKRV